MKKTILAGLAMMASLSAFADYECGMVPGKTANIGKKLIENARMNRDAGRIIAEDMKALCDLEKPHTIQLLVGSVGNGQTLLGEQALVCCHRK